jgi:hypothetical protein
MKPLQMWVEVIDRTRAGLDALDAELLDDLGQTLFPWIMPSGNPEGAACFVGAKGTNQTSRERHRLAMEEWTQIRITEGEWEDADSLCQRIIDAARARGWIK